jgi:Xaa-Pro aminopeptidase
MASETTSARPRTLRGRRARLAERLHGRPAVVFAGGTRPRNFPANVYTYRADSHFLYLAGIGIPNAVLIVHGDRAELFIDPEGEDDALWHGPGASWDDVAEKTGVGAVRPSTELETSIVRAATTKACATIPSGDPVTRIRQARLLSRAWPQDRAPAVDDLDDVDLALVDALIDLRLHHDDCGLGGIRSATEATCAAHVAGMAATRPGVREYHVRAAMEHEVFRRGMDLAFASIVTVHGEILHSARYHHELGGTDLLLADMGAESMGWASDVTRTWPVSGRFSPTQRAIYDIVLQAADDAIALVRPGTRYRDVHMRASLTLARGLVDEGILRGDPETLVERGAHALFFPHGIGHLMGLDVHDMEDLGDRAGYAPGRTRSEQFGLSYLRLDRDLQPDMVVTIEPGLYIVPAILANGRLCGAFDRDGTIDRERLGRFADVRGIRIEDDVLCTPKGPEVLTSLIPRQAADVEARVGVAAAV